MGDTAYADNYRNTDFRKHPEKYKIGRGEQGVLMAEPYKSEILPYWRFATPDVAEKSAEKIYELFESYGRENDFAGMDMARKFLQMGFTRARRYANHKDGNKYDENRNVRPQELDWDSSPKARSAKIFYDYYKRAMNDETYQRLKTLHKQKAS